MFAAYGSAYTKSAQDALQNLGVASDDAKAKAKWHTRWDNLNRFELNYTGV
jgi:hypothetical protein